MMNGYFRFFIPPPSWSFPVLIVVAVLAGLVVYLFFISRASSYLSDKPEACVNCHIMAPQYATWSHSSHREWTHCNDCHVPHNNIVNKYYFKAKDGLRHATIFTLRREPQVIFAHEPSQNVVQGNCLRCHDPLMDHFRYRSGTGARLEYIKERHCWDCHREVPHGRVNSLTSVPNARVPLPSSPVPGWLRPYVKTNTKNRLQK